MCSYKTLSILKLLKGKAKFFLAEMLLFDILYYNGLFSLVRLPTYTCRKYKCASLDILRGKFFLL